MKFLSGKTSEPFVMLHGGAGPMDPSKAGLEKATESLKRIAYETLFTWNKHSKLELASLFIEGLENDEGFNAGYGSALQGDGKPRLSASLMDGRRQRFSAVISLSDVRHPSRLALFLQHKSSRVLTAPGHELLARELRQPVENLVSPARFDAWAKKRLEKDADKVKDSVSYDTVGVVLSMDARSLFAGTSTGGRGNEEPGRVSDSATVAGNYASAYAAISLTGIGEEIVDDGVAVRIETRVRDGMSLEEACRKSYDEAIAANHEYGWIACDAHGNWCAAHTTDAMTFLVRTLEGEVLASS